MDIRVSSEETGLYYLESRYYDEGTGRLINVDSIEYLGEGEELKNYNLYVYCGNNPVNVDDSTGEWPKWLSGARNVVGGALQVTVSCCIGSNSWLDRQLLGILVQK